MVLSHLIEEVGRDLDSLPTKPARSIHAIRTRMKNLRAVIRLVKARVADDPRKQIMSISKGIKDAFSAERDAEVIGKLKMKVNGRRAAIPRGNGPQPGKAASKATSPEFARLRRLVGKLRLAGLDWCDVLDAYEGSYRAGRRGMKSCLGDASPGKFHRWRGPVKDLFYQSRVLQPLDGTQRRARLAQRLGDRLGKWNDLQMLADSAKGAEGRRFLKHVGKKRSAMRQSIFKVAAKLFADKPGKVRKELERCVKMLPAMASRSVRQA